MADTDQKSVQQSDVGSPSESATPYQQHPADQSFVLQCLIDLQKTVGALTKAVEKLESSVGEQSGKIDKIRYTLAGAGGAVTVILIIGAFALDKIWDRLISALQMAPPS